MQRVDAYMFCALVDWVWGLEVLGGREDFEQYVLRREQEGSEHELEADTGVWGAGITDLPRYVWEAEEAEECESGEGQRRQRRSECGSMMRTAVRLWCMCAGIGQAVLRGASWMGGRMCSGVVQAAGTVQYGCLMGALIMVLKWLRASVEVETGRRMWTCVLLVLCVRGVGATGSREGRESEWAGTLWLQSVAAIVVVGGMMGGGGVLEG